MAVCQHLNRELISSQHGPQVAQGAQLNKLASVERVQNTGKAAEVFHTKACNPMLL